MARKKTLLANSFFTSGRYQKTQFITQTPSNVHAPKLGFWEGTKEARKEVGQNAPKFDDQEKGNEAKAATEKSKSRDPEMRTDPPSKSPPQKGEKAAGGKNAIAGKTP